MKRKIVISGINIRNAGTLSIYHNMLDEILENKLDDEYDFTIMVSQKKLFDKYNKKIEIIEFPKEANSRIMRFFYEYIYFNWYSKKQDIFTWISINDKTPKVKAEHQFVYCHNPTMFYKCSKSDVKYSKLLLLYTIFYERLYRINIERNDAVIVQQIWIAREFENKFPIKKVFIMRPTYSSFPLSTNNTNAGICTFLYPTAARSFKNCEVLLEATRILIERGCHNFKVILTIKGNENAYASHLIEQYKQMENVSFIGFVSRERLEGLYACSTCLVFPSKLETWGLPMTEFSRYKKNIIAADLPYAHETLKDYHQKSFFKADDSNALADQMYEVIQGKIFQEDIEEIDIEPNMLLNSWADFFEKVKKL